MAKTPQKQEDWDLAALADLEYFLGRDAEADEEDLAVRDRELYRGRLEQSPPLSRRVLLRRWLELRREAARARGEGGLPGAAVAALARLLPLLLFGGALVSGAGLAWGVLSYAGARPINLFVALLLLVLLPFLLTLASALLPLARRLTGGDFSGPVVTALTGALVTRLGRFLTGGGKGRSASVWGRLRARGSLHAGVMGRLIFAWMQLAGLGFALGLWLTVLLRGWVADLAFSWQTTAQVSADQVYRLATLIARPWSALAEPPRSHPTLAQVEGSRVFLKEGLEHLANADLQAWWYFLLWAILVYALLPRLLLLGVALFGGARAKARLAFTDARCEGLLRRMRQGQMRIGRENAPVAGSAPLADYADMTPAPELLRLRALLPAELLAEGRSEAWRVALAEQFSGEVTGIEAVRLDEEEDAAVLAALAAEPAGISPVLVLEGWQPCITATLEYLKALRRALGKDRLLTLVLVGRDGGESARTPTPAREFDIWRGRLATLGDGALLVRNWRSAHD